MFEQKLTEFINENLYSDENEIYVCIGKFMRDNGYIMDKTYKINVSIKYADMLETTYLVQVIWYDGKINMITTNVYI